MRRNQYQREVLSRLARIDSNLEKISRELARQVERGKCAPAVQPIAEGASHNHEPDKWLRDGIDNILSYQAGKKREGEQ